MVPQGFSQKGYQSVLWTADDANEDQLEFAIYYRGENETSWKLLKDKLETRFYSWDTTAMPDGAYYLKIVASDAPSNPAGEELTAERESERFVVVNTPPAIAQLTADTPPGGAMPPCECDSRRAARQVLSRAHNTVWTREIGFWSPPAAGSAMRSVRTMISRCRKSLTRANTPSRFASTIQFENVSSAKANGTRFFQRETESRGLSSVGQVSRVRAATRNPKPQWLKP